VKQFLSQTGNRGGRVGEFESDAGEFEWRLLFVAGMWFPGSVQLRLPAHGDVHHSLWHPDGEISFCAYNTGVGWRNVIEKLKANASVAEWNRTHERHPVYAKNQDLPLPAPLGRSGR